MANGVRRFAKQTRVGGVGVRFRCCPRNEPARGDGLRGGVHLARCVLAVLGGLLAAAAVVEAGEAPPPTARNIALDGESALFTPLKDVGAGSAGLFVGVNRFTNPQASLRPLEFAVHDAIEQAYLFVIELRLIPPQNCCLALSGEPRHDTVRGHLQELERAKVKLVPADGSTILSELQQMTLLARQESDVLIVSLCSHGFDHERVAYVMPENGLRGFLKVTALPLPTIEEEMDKSKAGHRLLLVDACQERVAAGGKREIGGQPAAGMSQTFQAALVRPTGQAKLASCSVGEYSYEDPSLGGVGHGVFTFALLESLRGGAQAGPDNLVRLQAVADGTQLRVEAWVERQNRLFPDSPKKQSPSLHGPVKTRDMPLAERADDLTALVERVRQLRPTVSFDEQLQQQLLTALRLPADNRDEYRKLLQATSDFVANRMQEDYFVPFLKDWLRRNGRPMAGERMTPPAQPDPGSGPRPLEWPADEPTVQRVQEAWAASLGRTVVETLGPDDLKIPFVLVPPGRFRMGSEPDAVARISRRMGADERFFADEQPPHEVVISRPFFLSMHEITTQQFKYFAERAPYRTTAEKDARGGFGWNAGTKKFEQGAGYNYGQVGWDRSPANPDMPEHPVVNVSWDDAVAFCRWLTQQQPGFVYRLPTEAEWEYACRAGTRSLFPGGDDPETLTKVGNVADLTGKPQLGAKLTAASSDGYAFSSPVGRFPPNPLGLYDMYGNVWEWCADYYGEDYYQASPREDPAGPDGGELRVLRGGAWSTSPWEVRSAYRHKYPPGDPHYDYGFRIVCECH